MKWAIVGVLLYTGLVAIPRYISWLRHRPHRITEGTQRIVFAGLIAQPVLVVVATGLIIFRSRPAAP